MNDGLFTTSTEDYFCTGEDVLRLVFIGNKPKDDIEAIKISIEKWKAVKELVSNFEMRVVEDGPDTCGLCMLHFWRDEGDEDCEDCPIALEVNDLLCRETPYNNIDLAEGKDALPAIDEEIEFLEGLLRKYNNEHA